MRSEARLLGRQDETPLPEKLRIELGDLPFFVMYILTEMRLEWHSADCMALRIIGVGLFNLIMANCLRLSRRPLPRPSSSTTCLFGQLLCHVDFSRRS